MAEPISLGASIITLIGLTQKVLVACNQYIQNIKDIPSDLRVITLECSTLEATLKTLDLFAKHDTNISAPIASLASRGGLLERCTESIRQLEELVHIESKSTKKRNSRGQKKDITLAKLAWPFKRDKARSILNDIQQHKQSICLVLTVDSTQDIKTLKQDIKAVNERTETMHDILTDSQQQKIYQWLCLTDPSSLHYKAQHDYEKGTGEWASRLSKWRDWLDGKYQSLLLHGIPGAGKTILTSHLIKEAEIHCYKQTKRTVCLYYYCYYGRHQDEAKPFLRWTLCKLCQRSRTIPRSVRDMFKWNLDPSVPQLLAGIGDTLENFDIAYIFIDALDESLARGTIVDVLKTLVSLFKKIQLFASSREYSEILEPMRAFSTCVSMDNPALAEDIRIVVHSALHNNSNFQKWPSDLLKKTEKAISRGSKGMFRWAVCQVDLLQRLKWDLQIIEQQLASLPITLYDTYDKILCQIPREDQLFVHHVFQWVKFYGDILKSAGMPYSTLIQAVKKSMKKQIGRESTRYYDLEILQKICGCLIQVKSISTDRVDLTEYTGILFAHYTVSEYLHFTHFQNNSVMFLDPFKSNIQNSLTELVFRETYEITPNELQIPSYQIMLERAVSGTIWKWVDDNFNAFCAMMAIRACSIRVEEICEYTTLSDLMISLLDPEKAHFPPFIDVVRMMGHYGLINWRWSHITTTPNLWSIDVITMETNTANVFYLLLATYYSDANDRLCETLTQRYSTEALFQSRIKLSNIVGGEDVFSEQRGPYIFEGSLIEIFAQLQIFYNSSLFNSLVRVGVGYFDPTKTLLFYIAGHKRSPDHLFNGLHRPNNQLCPIKVLLQHGADPDAKGYQISPLQIAAACADIEGVKILLDAGASPNGIGDKDGFWWEDPYCMGIFKLLRGCSALHISIRKSNMYGDHWWDRGPRFQEMVDLLNQYEARDFCHTEDGVGGA